MTTLVVNLLTVVVSIISNSQVFLLQIVTHIFFSKNISIYAIFNCQSFDDTLSNGIVSLEEQGPG